MQRRLGSPDDRIYCRLLIARFPIRQNRRLRGWRMITARAPHISGMFACAVERWAILLREMDRVSSITIALFAAAAEEITSFVNAA